MRAPRLQTRLMIALATAVATIAAPHAGAAEFAAQTKLVHGPVVFRLTGYKNLSGSVAPVYARYYVLFKLNQVPKAEIYSLKNQTTAGTFRLDDGIYNNENGPDSFSRSGCLALVLFTPNGPISPTDNSALDAIRVGRRLKVSLRPLTPGPDGKLMLGRTYVSHPRMQTTDYRLREANARRELKRIGCSRTPAPPT